MATPARDVGRRRRRATTHGDAGPRRRSGRTGVAATVDVTRRLLAQPGCDIHDRIQARPELNAGAAITRTAAVTRTHGRPPGRGTGGRGCSGGPLPQNRGLSADE